MHRTRSFVTYLGNLLGDHGNTTKEARVPIIKCYTLELNVKKIRFQKDDSVLLFETFSHIHDIISLHELILDEHFHTTTGSGRQLGLSFEILCDHY